MKWFYISSAVVVAILSLSPLVLLRGEDPDLLAGKVVLYDTLSAKINSIDPATCGDTSSAGIQGNFYESLYQYDFLIRPLKVVPQLAAAMPAVSDDNLTYTISLQPDVKYHRNPCFGLDEQGRPKTRTVRAQDFVLAFKRICDYHVRSDLAFAFIEDKIEGIKEYRDKTRSFAKGDFSRYDAIDLSGVKALDDRTLQIRLTQPFPQLMYVLCLNNYAPVPHEVLDYHLSTRAEGGRRVDIPLQDRDSEIREPEAAVGTGPYYLHTWVKSSKLIMVRNEDFRDQRYPRPDDYNDLSDAQKQSVAEDLREGLYADAGKPVPMIDVRYLTLVEEDNPMWMLFMTRQSDTAGIPDKMYQQVVTPDANLTNEMSKEGIRLMKYTIPAVYWYVFNMEDPVLGKSKSLRQAMQLAFNVEEYIQLLFNGRGIRATTCIPKDFECHDESPSPYARYDLAEAKKKIEQARQELAAAGIIPPGGAIPPITLDLGGRDEHSRRVAEYAKGQFRQIGLELKVELNDWPTLLGKMHNKQCQMWAMGWHADYPDPENFLQLYYSPNIVRGTNNANYKNPAFDALYEKISVMQPSPQRAKLYKQMIEIINEDCPILLLSEPQAFVLVHPWIHNLKPHPVGYGFGRYVRLDSQLRRQMGGR